MKLESWQSIPVSTFIELKILYNVYKIPQLNPIKTQINLYDAIIFYNLDIHFNITAYS